MSYKNISQVIGKTKCPRCAEKGRDTTRDNLILYEDNGKYCFSCSYTVLSDTYKEENNIEKRELIIENERNF